MLNGKKAKNKKRLLEDFLTEHQKLFCRNKYYKYLFLKY